MRVITVQYIALCRVWDAGELCFLKHSGASSSTSTYGCLNFKFLFLISVASVMFGEGFVSFKQLVTSTYLGIKKDIIQVDG